MARPVAAREEIARTAPDLAVGQEGDGGRCQSHTDDLRRTGGLRQVRTYKYGWRVAARPRPGTIVAPLAAADCPDTCPTRQTVARLADRWTLLVLDRLATGPIRFGRLRAAIGGVSEKMLAQTLRSLERDGLIVRTVLDGVPPPVEYGLTELGTSLLAPLAVLRAWGGTHVEEMDRARIAYDVRVRAETSEAVAPTR